MNLGNINTNARIPIIPLPNDLIHLKTTGELVIDYENKKILLVDRNDSSIVHDLTSWVINHIDKVNGNIINVTIDGFGEIELSKILSLLLEKIENNTIEATDISDVAYYLEDGTIDLKSIKPKNNVLEINGYDSAKENTVPVKQGDGIAWLPLSNLGGGSNSGNKPPSVGGGNNGDISDGGDSDSSIDVAYGNVYDVIPQNNVLYPIISERQQSLFLSGYNTVILPDSIHSYVNVEWFILTGDTELTLIYEDTIFFEDKNSTKFAPNSRFRLSFKSYDKGKTWIGDIIDHNRLDKDGGDDNLNNYITIASLRQYLLNYYTKEEIDNKLQDIINNGNTSSTPDNPDNAEYLTINEFITRMENYFTKEEVLNEITSMIENNEVVDLSSYYNKTEIDEKFNDYTLKSEHESFKTEVNNRLDNINTNDVDLSDYYNKEEIDDKLNDYTSKADSDSLKTEINERIDNLNTQYYNKEEVENKINDCAPKEDYEIFKASASERLNVVDTDYYNKEEIDNKIDDYTTKEEYEAFKTNTNERLDNINNEYYNKTEIENKISDYTLKTDHETFKTEINERIDNIDTGGNTDLSNYYTKGETYSKSELDTLINRISNDISKVHSLSTDMLNRVKNIEDHSIDYLESPNLQVKRFLLNDNYSSYYPILFVGGSGYLVSALLEYHLRESTRNLKGLKITIDGRIIYWQEIDKEMSEEGGICYMGISNIQNSVFDSFLFIHSKIRDIATSRTHEASPKSLELSNFSEEKVELDFGDKNSERGDIDTSKVICSRGIRFENSLEIEIVNNNGSVDLNCVYSLDERRI